MRMVCCAALALSACYAPKVVGGAPCDPAIADSCPSGQSCVAAAGGGGVCTVGGSGPDAGTDSVIPTDGGTCLGKGLLGSVCLARVPTTAVTLSAGMLINTANAGAGGCTELRPQTGGPTLCIIAGTTIDVPAGAMVRGITLIQGSPPTSTNPLVLVATKSITIEGTLDVSTHFNETITGALALGAGARTATGCLAAGVDGPAGTGNSGGAGAAGGSFGTAGGSGGTGGNNGNGGRGTPAATTAPTVLVGGCPGGKGGDGAGAPVGGDNSGGLGGNPGGAIYLLAGESITVAGRINASGSGGFGGSAGNLSSGGGGGGGAGGMIGLEAGRITITGSLFANGGGGGAGGGNDGRTDAGTPGTDPTAALTVATGGSGSNGGGNGGAGAFGSTSPIVGKNGGCGSTNPECAGGGGGGGGGVIRVFGVPASSIGGTVSPPAS